MPTLYTDSTTPRQAPGSMAAATTQQNADYQRIFGRTVTPTTTTTAPVVPVPKRDPGLLQQAQDAAAEVANSRVAARREADAYAAQNRQARIDAINATFAPRIKREEDRGQANLSRVAALNLRAGIVGSGVDTTKIGEQKDLNSESMQALEAARGAAIAEAIGEADKLGKERADEIYNEKVQGAEANVMKYKNQTERAMKSLDSLGAQGISAKDLQEVDPNVYATLRDVSGMSDAEIDAYLKTKAPEGTYKWDASQVSGSTMYVPKVTNGKVTMEKVDLGYTPTKELQTTVKGADGNVYLIFKDGTSQILGGTGGAKYKADAPTWEDYLAAAQRAARMTFDNPTRDQLRTQYDKEYLLKDLTDYTSSEKKRLEQAGLLDADRKDQLDFLYGDSSGTIDFSSAQ